MIYIQQDYKRYIKNMETKDYAIVDPPWLYNDISPAVKKQLSYSLWDNNIKQMSFIFENIKVNIDIPNKIKAGIPKTINNPPI